MLLGVISAGNGLVLPSLISATLHGVPAHRSGAASGLLTTAQQFGGAAGVALIGTIYFAFAPAGHGTAMAWSASICTALVIAVAFLVISLERRAAQEHGPGSARASLTSTHTAAGTPPAE
jgi:putative exporter of polyketide antibiotics